MERSRLAWTILVPGAAVIALAGRWLALPGPDVSWLLDVTTRAMRGDPLGALSVRMHPSAVFAFTGAAAALGDVTHSDSWHAYIALLAALGVAASAIAAWLAAPMGLAWRAGLAGIAATCILPGAAFGQREHAVLILTLPYIMVAARRCANRPLPASVAMALGFVAGVGIVMKPHFALLPLALFALECARLGWRRAIRLPEHWALVAAGAAYMMAIERMAPEWRTYGARFAPLYRHFLTTGLDRVIFVSLAALSVVALVRRLRRSGDAAPAASATACVAFVVAYAAQAKGFGYHLLPALGFLVLLVALEGTTAGAFAPVRLARGLLVLVAVATLCWPVLQGVAALAGRPFTGLDDDPDRAALATALASLPVTGPVAVFSTNIGSAFPMVPSSGRRWALRHPSLWPLAALHRPREGRVERCDSRSTDPSAERAFMDDLAADLVAQRPVALVVLRPDSAAAGWGGALGYDYPTCLARDPRIAAEFRQFMRVATIGRYDLWRRR